MIRRRQLSLVLLAACAGSVNLLSITRLGGTLSGIVTGDLVTTGHAVGDLRWTLIRYPAVAICFFSLGVTLWTGWLLRTTRTPAQAYRVGLAAEFVVLLAIPAGMTATHGHPGGAVSVTMLGAAAAAMGAQSANCLHDGIPTTYLTGSVTVALHDLVVDRGRLRDGPGTLGRVLALIAAATATALLLTVAWWAAAVLPCVLLATALGAVPRSDQSPA